MHLAINNQHPQKKKRTAATLLTVSTSIPIFARCLDSMETFQGRVPTSGGTLPPFNCRTWHH